MQVNPKGRDKATCRVNRGGSRGTGTQYCLVSFHGHDFPNIVHCSLGFRIVLGVTSNASQS